MTCSRSYWLVAVGSALLLGASVGQAQQQGQQGPELVEPEVEGEAPPVMLEGAESDEPVDENVSQMLTSLNRAQESLRLGRNAPAMQALIQAEEQLDEAARNEPGIHPWQEMNHALQEAMKALAADNPRYAQIALQRVLGPVQGTAAEPAGDAEQQGDAGGQGGPVLASVSADDVLGAEVVNTRGESIAQVSDLVRGPGGDDELFAILDVGGFLGIAEKTVALPLDQLQVGEDDKMVLPQVTEDQLADMPVYDPEQYEQVQ